MSKRTRWWWARTGARGGARAHHVVEILPLHGERRHEGLGPRERGTVDRKVLEHLNAVLDEGDDIARLELLERKLSGVLLLLQGLELRLKRAMQNGQSL